MGYIGRTPDTNSVATSGSGALCVWTGIYSVTFQTPNEEIAELFTVLLSA
jgi:hypothetical protein